jgi:hypothetical protein
MDWHSGLRGLCLFFNYVGSGFLMVDFLTLVIMVISVFMLGFMLGKDSR